MQLGSSEARNPAALAISSGSPGRPGGTRSTILSLSAWAGSSSGATLSSAGVRGGPGARELTWMPRSGNSADNDDRPAVPAA